VEVLASNGSHIIKISKIDQLNFQNTYDANEALIAKNLEIQNNQSSSCTFKLSFMCATLGVSLMVEKPVRRELFSLYVDGLRWGLESRGCKRSLEFLVEDVQVDNYSESAIYPVLLHSKRKDSASDVMYKEVQKNLEEASQDAMSSDGLIPFIQMTIVQDFSSDSPIVQYAAFRMISFAVELDSATFQLLFMDFLDDLKLLNRSQALAMSLPHRWINEYNSIVLRPTNRTKLLEHVYWTKVNAQKSKIYFKALIIHPIKVTLTFTQTIFPRR